MPKYRFYVVPLLATYISVWPCTLSAQGLKEGEATFVTRSSRTKSDTIVQLSKGRQMRIDGMDGRNQGSIIIDGERKRVIVLDAGSKKAMIMTERDAKQVEGLAAAFGVDSDKRRTAERADKPTITKTGRMETVGGVRCEVIRVTTTRHDRTEEGDACVAKGVGFGIFDAMASVPIKGAAGELERYRSIVGPGMGLVKATTMKDGKPLTVLELLAFKDRDVPASAFEIPAGYEAQSIGDVTDMAREALDQLKRKKPKSGGPKPSD